MPEDFEFHCFGGRLGPRGTDALGAIGLRPVGPGETGDVELLDCGDGGTWLRGPGARIGDLAPRAAAALGRAVRHYRVRVTPATDPQPVTVSVEGATWWPDGRRVAIRGVEDRFDDEEASSDPAELASEALSVTLEVHEQLHHDDASVARWTTAG